MGKGYKQTEEHRRKIGLAHKGKIASKSSRKKMSESKKRLGIKPPSQLGRKRTTKFKKNLSKRMIGNKITLGTKQTPESNEKRSKTLRGKNGPNWKGGKTTLAKIIRSSFKYRQWRSDIFTRDDFTCHQCGIRGNQSGGYLEAHHMKKFSKIIEENKIESIKQALNCEELWNINNGITLCKRCHDKTKRGVPEWKL